MPDFLQLILDYVSFYRLELIGGAILIALYFLKKKYDDNVIISRYINAAAEAIANRMDAATEQESADVESGKVTLTKRAASRRKVRRRLAQEARKANRGTSKGQKRGQ